MKDFDVFVHARHADGTTDIVGRYRTLRPTEARPLGEFTYVPSWLRNDHGRAFALDPANLPLLPPRYVTQKRLCIPGALADATPDRWGRRVIEATMNPSELPLSSSGWLLATGDDRVGCLTFSPTPKPATPSTPYAGILDLPAIAAGFERIEAGEPAEPAVQHLFNIVRSLGGARPKATMAHEGSLWIAKFQKSDDEFDQCCVEHATMRMAGLCGIDVPETRVERIGRRRVLLVKRFDRAPEPAFHPNAHFLSALSALDIDETEERGSYAEIAGFLRRYGSDQEADRIQLFRRMAFNVLCGNRDDHLKNHAFLLREGRWRLSPAFDIVPQPRMEPLQAVSIGRLGGTSTILNCLSMTDAFGIGKEAAKAMLDDLVDRMRGWRTSFSVVGCDDRSIRAIEPAFALVSQEPIDDATPSSLGF